MATTVFAQEPQTSVNRPFSIKAQGFMGGYLSPSGNIKDISPNAPTGINFGVELPSTRQKPWQQYLNGSSCVAAASKINSDFLVPYPDESFPVNQDIDYGDSLTSL